MINTDDHEAHYSVALIGPRFHLFDDLLQNFVKWTKQTGGSVILICPCTSLETMLANKCLYFV